MILKRRSCTLAIALLLFIQVFRGQVTITIPTNNLNSSGLTMAEWRKPLGSYYGYERSAMIYQHSEIGQLGSITSLAFYCDTVNIPGNVPVNIYMKEIAGSAFASATTVSQEETNAQPVFSGTLSASSFVKGQWTLITLTNPFLHATANSIEVIVETNATGTGNEGILAKGFYHYVTSIYAFQYWSADNSAPNGPGTFSYKRPNIQFGLTPISACSGAPNAGTTVSSVDSTCSAVSLYLNGATTASGLTYQWQDSLAGGAWTNVAGATGPALSTTIADTTWFRCQVSCGSQSSYSSVKQLIKYGYMQCYCNANLGGGCSGSAIDSVAIAGTFLVTSATGCSANNYTLYPASGNTCAQLASGQSYNLHTRFNGAVIASAWIDYDQNGSFDSLEWKQITTSAKIDSDYVTTLSVPVNAKTGLTIMRIRSRAAGNINDDASACTNFGSGETEDYFIGINYDVKVNEALNKQPQVVIYPNPNAGTLWLAGNFKNAEQVLVELYSLEGILVHSARLAYHGDPLSLSLNSLAPGAYLARVNCSAGQVTRRLLLGN